MPAEALRCKECQDDYALDASYVCERCFGPLEVAYAERTIDRRRGGAAPHPGRSAEHLALRRLPAGEAPPGSAARDSLTGLPAGCTPLVKADRLAERLGLGEVWVKNDSANPTHSFKDRVVAVALARARELGFEVLTCASTGNLANSVAATAAAYGMESYVFIPHDLEEQKVLATGIYGTKLVAVQGQLRRRQPPVHGALGRARGLGVRQRQPAPVLRGGLQDAGVRDGRAARLGDPRPRGRPDRLGLAVHEDRPRLRGVARARADRGRDRPHSTAPRRSGCSPVAPRPTRRGTTSASRSSRRRSRSRWRSATRPTAPTRSTSRAAPAAAIDSVTDDEIREGISLLAETTGIFTETAGGVTTAVLAKLAERGDIGRDERVVALHHRGRAEDDRRRDAARSRRTRSSRRSPRSRRALPDAVHA